MTYKTRIKLALCSALLLGAASGSWAGQTIKDVKRVYEKLLRANNLPAIPLYVVKDDTCGTACYIGNAIIVTPWGLGEVKNTDELAVTLGHELAHMRTPDESGADKLGAKYTARAGYNVCRGAQRLKLYIKDETHPLGTDRFYALGCR